MYRISGSEQSVQSNYTEIYLAEYYLISLHADDPSIRVTSIPSHGYYLRRIEKKLKHLRINEIKPRNKR